MSARLLVLAGAVLLFVAVLIAFPYFAVRYTYPELTDMQVWMAEGWRLYVSLVPAVAGALLIAAGFETNAE